MSKYEYVKTPSRGKWLVEVRKGSSVKGNIRKHPVTGRFQFFRGALNVIRPVAEEGDMDTLIERIEELSF